MNYHGYLLFIRSPSATASPLGCSPSDRMFGCWPYFLHFFSFFPKRKTAVISSVQETVLSRGQKDCYLFAFVATGAVHRKGCVFGCVASRMMGSSWTSIHMLSRSVWTSGSALLAGGGIQGPNIKREGERINSYFQLS